MNENSSSPNRVNGHIIGCLLSAIFLAGCTGEKDVKSGVPMPVVQGSLEGKTLAVPESGAYAGAYIDFGETEDHVPLEQIQDFEQKVGKHQAIIASSSYWGEQSFPRENMERIIRHGSFPLIYWSPWDKPYQQEKGPDRFSLRRILKGEWDAYIDEWGRQAKAFGKPFMVSWGLEMNGCWFPWSGTFYGENERRDVHGLSLESARARLDKKFLTVPYFVEKRGDKTLCFYHDGPELFKRAYRYVVDRVRAQGGSNVLWLLHYNNYPSPNEMWNMMQTYYPGKDYVDWIGLSVYGMQFRYGEWSEFDPLLEWPYTEMSRIDPSKPLMLAEWGVGEFPKSGDKGEWIEEGFRMMRTKYPKIKAAVFWHERWMNSDGTYSNLRVHSSPNALKAYREGVAHPHWLSHPIYSERP